MNAPVGSVVGKCRGLICSRRKHLGKVPGLGWLDPRGTRVGGSQGRVHLLSLCPPSCHPGHPWGAAVCAGLGSLLSPAGCCSGTPAGGSGAGRMGLFVLQKEVTRAALLLPQGCAPPRPAFGSTAGRERGWCLSQTCKWIKGFQMQISRLGCRSLRDMDGAAPWGWAATCQGGPMPQGARHRRLSWGPGCSWVSPGVPAAPGESQQY